MFLHPILDFLRSRMFYAYFPGSLQEILPVMNLCMYVYVCLCMSMYVYVCLCMSMYVHVCLCMSMYVYVCVYVWMDG